MRPVVLWLSFVLFLVVCYVAGCSARDDAGDIACATVGACACYCEVQYQTYPHCAVPSEFTCAPDECPEAGGTSVQQHCHNGVTVTLDLLHQTAIVTKGACTETLAVTASCGTMAR